MDANGVAVVNATVMTDEGVFTFGPDGHIAA